MKKILAILTLQLIAGLAFAGIRSPYMGVQGTGVWVPPGITQVAFVTAQAGNCGDVSGVTSPSFTPNVGNLIVVLSAVGTAGGMTISSTEGDSFTQSSTESASSGRATMWTATATTGNARTVTVYDGSAAYNHQVFVWVLSNWGSFAAATPVTNASTQTTPLPFVGTSAGSWLIGGGYDYSSWTGGWTPGALTTNVLGGSTAYDDCRGDTIFAFRSTNPSAGGDVTLTGDLGVAGQQIGMVGIEIKP